MASLEEIRAKLGGYIDGSLSLDEFEDWFLANTWNCHLHSDEETVKLVHRIEGNLLDFSAGAITERSLRKELALGARSFVALRRAPVLLIAKAASMSMPQLVDFPCGPNYQLPHQVISRSVSIPERVELPRA